jgi:hypothetical protein
VSVFEKAIKPLLLDTATIHRPSHTRIAEIGAKAEFETYYGVIVQRSEKVVRVPPQKDKTPKQIASALYRSSRENFGPTANMAFTVSSDKIRRASRKRPFSVHDDSR